MPKHDIAVSPFARRRLICLIAAAPFLSALSLVAGCAAPDEVQRDLHRRRVEDLEVRGGHGGR